MLFLLRVLYKMSINYDTRNEVILLTLYDVKLNNVRWTRIFVRNAWVNSTQRINYTKFPYLDFLLLYY